MKNIFKLLLVSLIFTACEDVEPTVYNSSATENTFLSFSRTVYSLPIIQNADGSVTLTLNSSTVSSVDRTYNLEILETNAEEGSYDFPETITIPAGSYQGTAVVTGTDVNVTQAIKTVVFRISNLNGESMDVEEVTLNIYEVCPLLDDFTGTYTVQQLTDGIGTPMIQPGLQVQFTEGDSEFERVFTAPLYPVVPGAPRTFIINFSCGNTFLAQDVVSNIQCTANNLITLSAADEGNAATYTADDDSVFELTISEDTTSSCDGPVQTTFRFTKVN